MGSRGPVPARNPRRRNARPPAAGTIASRRPAVPRELAGEARKEWQRVTAYLVEVGAIHLVDRTLLIRYCVAWSEWVELNDLLQKTGRLVTGQKGNLVRNPVWLLRRDAEVTLQELTRELAITPAARLRLGVRHEDPAPAADAGDDDGVSDFEAMRERLRG